MNINGMPRMLGALCTAAIVTGVSAIAPSVFAQPASNHNNDDAIVRDLKSGKLTVREAEMLRDRNAPKPAPAHMSPPPPPPPHKAARPLRPPKPGHPKPSRPPKKVQEHKAPAPIHHATHPHRPVKPVPVHPEHRKGAHARHPEPAVHAPHKAHGGHPSHESPSRHGKPHPKTAKVAAADHRAPPPVRHQAVRYVR